MNYTKGDYVVYGINGICKIDDIAEMDFAIETKDNMYYVLRPANNKNSTLFVPCEKEELVAKMRRVLTRAEIDDILSGVAGREIEWIDEKNVRANTFKEILSEGHTDEILLLIRCIYQRKSNLQLQNKKLSMADENVLSSLEKLICDEFAFVLGIKSEEVGEYIRSML